VSFRKVAVQQACRRSLLDGCGERPAQVHGIAQPQVKSLASERRVNVRGIAR